MNTSGIKLSTGATSIGWLLLLGGSPNYTIRVSSILESGEKEGSSAKMRL